jgi:putative ABC transport system permease protein
MSAADIALDVTQSRRHRAAGLRPVRLLRLARHAAGALWSQKAKAFLMMIGTAVGIMLLTAVVGLSAGVQQRIDQITAFFGPRSIMVGAGGGQLHGVGGRAEAGTTLKLQDAQAIEAQYGYEAVVAPGIFSGDANVKAGGVGTQTHVVCSTPDYSEAFDWYVQEGEPIDSDDERSMARSAVLGTTVATNLFGTEDPIGKHIFINNVPFVVKGLLTSKGTSAMGFDMDDRIWIPLSTGMNRLFHQDYIRFIRLKVRPDYKVASVVDQITQLLRQRHRIVPPEQDDFRIITPDFIAQRVQSMARTTELVGAALALVALLVGGVVLMNILLLSLSERVPEIGLKRALGARQRDILVEFLSESVLVSLFGMILGVLLGLVPVLLIPRLFPMMPMAVSWKTFAYAALFSTGVGLLFGVQPARRAAKLNPVEALR